MLLVGVLLVEVEIQQTRLNARIVLVLAAGVAVVLTLDCVIDVAEDCSCSGSTGHR